MAAIVYKKKINGPATHAIVIGVGHYLRYVVPRATLGAIPPLALLMWFRVGVDVQNLAGLAVAGVTMLALFGLTWILFVYRDDPYVRLPLGSLKVEVRS